MPGRAPVIEQVSLTWARGCEAPEWIASDARLQVREFFIFGPLIANLADRFVVSVHQEENVNFDWVHVIGEPRPHLPVGCRRWVKPETWHRQQASHIVDSKLDHIRRRPKGLRNIVYFLPSEIDPPWSIYSRRFGHFAQCQPHEFRCTSESEFGTRPFWPWRSVHGTVLHEQRPIPVAIVLGYEVKSLAVGYGWNLLIQLSFALELLNLSMGESLHFWHLCCAMRLQCAHTLSPHGKRGLPTRPFCRYCRTRCRYDFASVGGQADARPMQRLYPNCSELSQ